jgi:hypothetical protein
VAPGKKALGDSALSHRGQREFPQKNKQAPIQTHPNKILYDAPNEVRALLTKKS